MKLPAGINQWLTGILGLVSVLLIAHLVGQITNPRPVRSTPLPTAGRAARASAAKAPARSGPDDLARYDPSIHLEALKQLASRGLPEENRNPFDYAGAAPAKVAEAAAPTAAAPAPPPPPPPPPIKARGYNEGPGGSKSAFVSFQDQAQEVQEGDTVGSKFKVVKITPTAVTVEDAETHQTTELPIPQ